MTPAVALVVAAALAAILSYAMAVGLRRWAVGRNLLDHPTERSLHAVPTPRTGGYAIIVGTAIAVAALVAAGACGFTHVDRTIAFALVPIVLIGAIEDVRPMPTLLRLAVHATAAVGLLAGLWFGPRTVLTDMPGVPAAIVLGAAAVWVVGLINAYNFMDGIDGLAGTHTVVAALAWGLIAGRAGQSWVSAAALMMAPATAAFLVLNWPRRGLFMGDAGSTSIGFMFAAFTVASVHRTEALAGAVFMWPFVFDTSYTFARRLLRGENVLTPHRSHLYQRLVIAGWSHRRTSITYAGLAIGAAVAGIVFADPRATAARRTAAAAMLPLMSLAVLWVVRSAERTSLRRSLRPSGVSTDAWTN